MKNSSSSLLKIPLVNQVLTDKNFKIKYRAISQKWFYEKIIPVSLVGFNPLHNSAFVGVDSQIAKWLKHPEKSARSLNSMDHLVKEVLILVHDYLHAWAYLAINEIIPKMGFGTKPIQKSNFEDFVFCHLLTEAIAVTGLDYWYLSTVNLNEVCNLGTNISNLSISYRESNLTEYRRFNSELVVQEEQFLSFLTHFYCDGKFYGFDRNDCNNSAQLEKWINHETSYGTLQRSYTRTWLHHLSSQDFTLGNKSLDRFVVANKPWQKKLLSEISTLLWDLIKNEKQHPFDSNYISKNSWRFNSETKVDMRFLNLNALDPDECAEKIIKLPNLNENFKYLFYQYLSKFDFDFFNPELIKLIPDLIEKKDFKLVKLLFKNEKIMKKIENEPKELFLLN